MAAEKHPFEYHRPTVLQVERMERIRKACRALYEELLCLESSRQRALAMTKLEECGLWANKAIVFGPDSAALPVERAA
jgi:hypothetical protein